MNHINTARIISMLMALCLALPVFAANGNNGNNGNGNGPADKVDVIMVYDAKPDQAEKDRVKGLGGETRREFKNFNMRAIRVSENALKGLANGKGVKFIAPDRETFGMALTSISPSAPTESAAHKTAGMPDSATKNGEMTGWGVGVAIIDSGVGSHVDLSSSIKQYSFEGGNNPIPKIDENG